MTPDPIAPSLDAVVTRGQREVADLTSKAEPLTQDEHRRLARWAALLTKLQAAQRRQAKRDANGASVSELAALLKDDPEVQRLIDAPVVAKVAGRGKR